MNPVLEAGVRRFLDAEGADLQGNPRSGGEVAVAAIGTTAAGAVRGALLSEAIAVRGMQLAGAVALDGPERLLADRSWQLGVVLSPYKQQMGRCCDWLAPSAARTGVVDSVLRLGTVTAGFNTNTWAALSALEVLTAGAAPSRVLVLGAGASARSVALAVSRAWPDCRLAVAARRHEAAEELVAVFGGAVAGDPPTGDGDDRPELVINTTTWGETEASEARPFFLDSAALFAPGGRLFDLNNRISALQHAALRAGCAVVSGGVMQRVTNACRAALAGYAG